LRISDHFSFGNKLRDFDLEAKAKLPGPSNYEVKPIGWSPGYKFSGMASRSQMEAVSLKETKLVPGPGSYQLSMAPTKAMQPRFGFSKAGRDILDGRNVPGPGSYERSSIVGNEGMKSALGKD